jgi:Ca2+-binding EF-hand superfamily protein
MVDTERFAAAFAMMDKDGDGRVTAAEFKELMGSIGVKFTDENAAKAIEMMDKDGDGLVSLEELATYMSTPHRTTES